MIITAIDPGINHLGIVTMEGDNVLYKNCITFEELKKTKIVSDIILVEHTKSPLIENVYKYIKKHYTNVIHVKPIRFKLIGSLRKGYYREMKKECVNIVKSLDIVTFEDEDDVYNENISTCILLIKCYSGTFPVVKKKD